MKESYCSKCLKKCYIKSNIENPIKTIGRIWCSLLLLGKNKQGFSVCCNSKVIYLNIKERILIELEDEQKDYKNYFFLKNWSV